MRARFNPADGQLYLVGLRGWSSGYGSPEISTLIDNSALPAGKAPTTHHDPIEVKAITLSKGKRSVFLEVPGIKPVMQMTIGYQVRSASGVELDGEIINTIHALGK